MDHQQFTIEVPIEAIYSLEPIELPPNMERIYQSYLEDEDIKNSGLYDMMTSRKKYAGVVAMMGQIIANMFEGDSTLEESYHNLKGYLTGSLNELDEMLTDVFPKKMVDNVFKNIFHDVIRTNYFKDKEKYARYEKVVSIGMNIENPKYFMGILDDLDLDVVVNEILADEHISESIETNYIKPFKDILKEYVDAFLDRDEALEAFSEVFVQSKKSIAYQAAIQVVVNEAINKGLNISNAVASLGIDNIVAESKKVIEGFVVLEDYKEEIIESLKILIKGAQ